MSTSNTLAFISDLHGNAVALRAVLTDLQERGAARSATAFPWRSDMKARVLELLILLPTPYSLLPTPYSLLLEVQRDLHNVDGCPIFGRLLKDNQGSASGLLYIKGYRHIKGPSGPGAGACHHHLLCDDQAVPIHDVHLEYRFEGVGCAGYAQGTLHSVADGGRLHQYCRGHEPLIVAAIDRMVQDYALATAYLDRLPVQLESYSANSVKLGERVDHLSQAHHHGEAAPAGGVFLREVHRGYPLRYVQGQVGRVGGDARV